MSRVLIKAKNKEGSQKGQFLNSKSCYPVPILPADLLAGVFLWKVLFLGKLLCWGRGATFLTTGGVLTGAAPSTLGLCQELDVNGSSSLRFAFFVQAAPINRKRFITSSCTRLKHMATKAIPVKMYAEHAQRDTSSAFLPGRRSPKPEKMWPLEIQQFIKSTIYLSSPARWNKSTTPPGSSSFPACGTARRRSICRPALSPDITTRALWRCCCCKRTVLFWSRCHTVCRRVFWNFWLRDLQSLIDTGASVGFLRGRRLWWQAYPMVYGVRLTRILKFGRVAN